MQSSLWKVLFCLTFFLSSWALAQIKPPAVKSVANPNTAQKALITGEQSYIFQQPNFDAEVITILTPNKTVYFISSGKWGPFYKIRLAPGKTGYVLDSDIRIFKNQKDKALTKETESNAVKESEKEEPEADKKRKGRKPRRAKSFKNARHWGPVLQMTDFTENTINEVRHQYLPFYGVKISGPQTVFDDDTNTESNILIHWGVPGYYNDTTGNSASGFLILADILWESTQQQSKNVMTFFGAGPMFRYSHISSTLTIGTKKTEYALDDMVLGAAFNAGMVTRIKEYALRLDTKYSWEKQKYWSIGLAFQFEF